MEYLAEPHNIIISQKALRKLMITAGLWKAMPADCGPTSLVTAGTAGAS